MDVTGSPDGPPTRAGVAMTDYLAGLYAMQGILLALLDRAAHRSRAARRHRAARFADVGDDAAARHPLGDRPRAAPDGQRPPVGRAVRNAAGRGRLDRRRGRQPPALDRSSAKRIGADGLPPTRGSRPTRTGWTNRPALKAAIEAVFATLTVDEILARLRARQVPCGRVRTIEQAIADPQLRARQMVLDLEVPGLGTVKNIGNPIKLSRVPAARRARRAAARGAHRPRCCRHSSRRACRLENVTR